MSLRGREAVGRSVPEHATALRSSTGTGLVNNIWPVNGHATAYPEVADARTGSGQRRTHPARISRYGLTPQVCELDLIFNFQKAYAILDELIIAGELQESSKKAVLRIVRPRPHLLAAPGAVPLVSSMRRAGPPAGTWRWRWRECASETDFQVAQSDAIEEGESLATTLKESGF